jgi:hypothetical protein
MRFLPLLFALCACTSVPSPRADHALAILRGIGDAILRIDGFTALQKYAPELIMIVDVDRNGTITLQELEESAATIASDHEMAALLLATAIYLERR